MKVDSGIRGADPSNCCLGQLLINQANHAGAIWWLTVAWWLCYLHDGLVSRQEISRPCACEFQSPRADRVVKWDAMFGFRQSKFKHIYGQGVKRELSYDNVRVTKNAWDSNLIKVNPLYLSVNWDSAGRPPLPPPPFHELSLGAVGLTGIGGGALAVIPLTERGKLPDIIPLFKGHSGPVLDTDFNPFNDSVLASASEDGKVNQHQPRRFQN